jgi:hypothetical protein
MVKQKIFTLIWKGLGKMIFKLKSIWTANPHKYKIPTIENIYILEEELKKFITLTYVDRRLEIIPDCYFVLITFRGTDFILIFDKVINKNV